MGNYGTYSITSCVKVIYGWGFYMQMYVDVCVCVCLSVPQLELWVFTVTQSAD